MATRSVVRLGFAGVAGVLLFVPMSCRDGVDGTAPIPNGASGSGQTSGVDASAAVGIGTSTAASDGPSTLCRKDRDCPVDEVCCPSGSIGTCRFLPASSACPAPDLTLAFPPEFRPRLEHRPFYDDDCLLEKCVIAPGARRLLRFPLEVANRGDAPMILGLRDAPDVRQVACDGSLFLDDFLRYELLDAEGARRASGSGNVGVACELDWMAQASSPFDCDTLGMAARSYRSYASTADCQWIDVTTLPPGEYTLRVSVNAESRLAEQDVGNNVLERAVTIAASDPLAPCDPEDAPEANIEFGFGDAIECGWELIAGQTGVPCVPGELVALECTFCNGAYLPRVCPGIEPCSGAGAVRYSSFGSRTMLCSSEHTCDGFGQCTEFPFVCPASGQYTLLGIPLTPVLPMGSAPASAPSSVICTDVEAAGP